MEFEKFIDEYLSNNRSIDPENDRHVRLACVTELAAMLNTVPAGVAAPDAYHTTLGDACLRLKLFPEALAYYEQALPLAPKDSSVVYSKLFTLLKCNKYSTAVSYAEEVLQQKEFAPGARRYPDIALGYLSALAKTGQGAAEKYSAIVNDLLTRYPNNIYAHFYAAKYYNLTDAQLKVRAHVNKIVELTEETTEANRALGYRAEFAELVVGAAVEAINRGERDTAWRFIGHLMNSEYPHQRVLRLREAASTVFPPKQKAGANHTL